MLNSVLYGLYGDVILHSLNAKIFISRAPKKWSTYLILQQNHIKVKKKIHSMNTIWLL